MEDKMTKGLQKNFYEKIIRCRKDMLHLQSFLTQLADMADIFRSNTNHLFEAEERKALRSLPTEWNGLATMYRF